MTYPKPESRLPALLCAVLVAAFNCVARVAPAAAEAAGASGFTPALVDVRLVSDRVKPGGRLGITYAWRNDGVPADVDYLVFAHFEYPRRDCAEIVFQHDHSPLVPSSAWEAGRLIEDGPYSVAVPAEAPEGIYAVHVGLWDPATSERKCETYWGEIELDADAPPVTKPEPLAADEIHRRLALLDARLTSAQTIESKHIAFTVSADNGCYRLLDKQSGACWHSSPFADGFASVALRLPSGKAKHLRLTKPERVTTEERRLIIEYAAPDAGAAWRLMVTVQLVPDGRSVEFSWAAVGDGAEVTHIDLLSDALWTTDAAQGCVVVPNGVGLMLSADSGEAYLDRFDTFRWRGCVMEMLGVVNGGSAALISWHDPYATAFVKSVIGRDSLAPGSQAVAPSLRVHSPESAVRITLIPHGGYVEIAKAYRDVARDKGLLVTWTEKAKRWPTLQLDKLFGAPDIKPFVLSRAVRSSRYFRGEPDAEETVSIGYTFDEAAQVAEHLRHDLGIEKALFVLAGWIHRGYDNQHPDILPAAPECGGNDGLADASARIRKLGYLFGLHDNYQDMYRDAPSWSEDAIMKRNDGRLLAGGNWAGGQAWLICSKQGLELAARPQHNLPRVKELFDPTAYFIDTTFAASLYECFDPAHPLTRWDDMDYKAALSEFSASLFGVHGSEDGVEWAVPHASYFEGMLSERDIPPYGRAIPLFELVYRDCIALYTHQGDRAYPNRPDYIVRHIGLGRMPLYGFGPHLYWSEERAAPIRAHAAVAHLEQTGPRTFTISYRWTVDEDLADDWRVFVHFTRADGEIAFQDDHEPEPPTTAWRAGSRIVIGPHEVEAPEGLEGRFDIRIGLVEPGGGGRALLADADDGTRRCTIGRVRVSGAGRDAEIALEPQETVQPDLLCLARSDGGWAHGLCLTDTFIKNTYEVMSPLNEMTAALPMTEHEFLTPDGAVQRTVFGDRVEVIVNLGREDYAAATPGGEALLPPYGFSIWGPQFRAFHALSWQDIEYDRPALFAVRALDGRSIEESRRLRVFHGFGEPVVKTRGKIYIVENETVISESD